MTMIFAVITHLTPQTAAAGPCPGSRAWPCMRSLHTSTVAEDEHMTVKTKTKPTLVSSLGLLVEQPAVCFVPG